ncbi:hypothetical protein [Schumannella soli]|uniref:Uncharacterized protein n=1 Tax=Schumannella soli TaxID=2590779 RepID=A0A506Y707_9MICO|nr:hypothetical protein [Schumannella soli]TPW77643.1 hypothetical protein FJ657_02995 [Schumannella soli]
MQQTYDDLPTIAGELKRSAIDAYMAEQHFGVWVVNDGWYAVWGWAPGMIVKRPDADGSGGGEYTALTPDYKAMLAITGPITMAPRYDALRARVDRIVSPWFDLPDGAQCADPQSRTQTVAGTFGRSGSDQSVSNSGELGTANQDIATSLTEIRGSFKAPFADKYKSQLGVVMAGIGTSSAIIEKYYEEEAAIWPAARSDVTSLCVKTKEALDTAAQSKIAAEQKFVLTCIGAVIAIGATALSGGAAAIPLAAIAGGISVAIGALDADAVIKGDGYDAILTSLEDALDNLNAGIAAGENGLHITATDTARAIMDDLKDFNLAAFPLGDYPDSSDVMQMDRGTTNTIDNNMRRILEGLEGAVAKLSTPPSTSPVRRQSGIGFDADGGHRAITALWDLTFTCLRLTAAEYEHGRALFNASVEDYFHTDGSARDALRALVGELV